MKGAGGIIFLSSCPRSVKEAAAGLGPGYRKKEEKKCRLQAQHTLSKLQAGQFLCSAIVVIPDGERREVQRHRRENKEPSCMWTLRDVLQGSLAIPPQLENLAWLNWFKCFLCIYSSWISPSYPKFTASFSPSCQSCLSSCRAKHLMTTAEAPKVNLLPYKWHTGLFYGEYQYQDMHLYSSGAALFIEDKVTRSKIRWGYSVVFYKKNAKWTENDNKTTFSFTTSKTIRLNHFPFSASQIHFFILPHSPFGQKAASN